ncbi:unnamed protein product [Adineta ricciae]|uniref:Uncharacterized protein n=1 Tax=Adineta ricciae TaxID=249248 RepID=A0A815GJW0_ADIRI|nr:unnamed protein product [Adineta ricciae]
MNAIVPPEQRHHLYNKVHLCHQNKQVFLLKNLTLLKHKKILNEDHTLYDTAPSALLAKKAKTKSDKGASENYKVLTDKLGKIPKKAHSSSETAISKDN